MPRLIVDSRESVSGLAKMLEKLGAEVVIEQLESADFVLAEGVGVERKEATDFVNSLIHDKRIQSQVAMLKATYARPFLLLEGDVFNTRSTIAPEALLGALSWITVIEGVQIVHTKDTRQSAQMLLTMQRHALEGLGYEVALRGPKPKDRRSQVWFALEGLPMVGPSTAKKLAARFGTVHAVFNATIEQLREVDGIGPKMAATIHEVLRFDSRGS